MKLKVDKVTIDQLCEFIGNARPKDLEECYHMTGYHFIEEKLSVVADCDCLYDEETGDVYAIGGVEDNIIWMLCTFKAEEHPIAFLRFCKEYLKNWLDKYHFMSNWVWLGNDQHIKWLKWMGATFMNKTTHNGQPFQYFYFKEKE